MSVGGRDRGTSAAGWHVQEDHLLRYARQTLPAAHLWSTEEHLAACAYCRERLADAVDPDLVAGGWARLDAELDAPPRGLVETLLVRVGVAEDTARLLVATPTSRRSWFAALVLTLAMGVVAGNAARPVSLFFLSATPLLPVVGVGLSFGAGIDPAYEVSLVAPMHGLRLLVLRTVSVLATTVTLGLPASLALPSFGLATLAWLLPALALTSLSLLLMPRFGPVWASGLVAAGWVTAMALSVAYSTGRPLPFSPAGQLVAAATAVAVVVLVSAGRDRFDFARSLD